MAIKAKRLLKLADYLETVPRKQFDMNTICENRDCGFAGCAVGWAIHGNLFRGLTYDESSFMTVYNGTFGIEGVDELFGEDSWDNLFASSLGGTPKQVSKRIRKFVRDHSKVST